MSQHSSLSPERWAQFNLDQQILMIGNEMNRAKRSIELGDRQSLSLSYERVLRLLDLTVEVQQRPTLRRETGVVAVAGPHRGALYPDRAQRLGPCRCFGQRSGASATELTASSRASRKPRAAIGLRAAYQSLASSASASAAGCQISSLKATEETLPHFRPGNRLDSSRFQFFDAPTDLHVPGLLGVRINLTVEALDQDPGN